MSVIIPEERLELDSPVHQFPYRLDDFQSNGCYATQNGKNVLITAHTAAGKTTIAEYAIALSQHLGKKVLYTSPIKTLSNQKFYDFQRTFGNVGILTGDIKLNPEADIIVLTTEILRNKLDHELEQLDDVHCVIFDEVHYFNDPERGFVWEECITKLPKHILLVMLSATIDRAEDFAKWVADCRERDCYLIGTTWRPVPLNHYIYTDNEIVMINKHKMGAIQVNIDKTYDFYKTQKFGKHRLLTLSEYLGKKGLFPAICFSFSRKKCEEYCKMLKKGSGLLSQEELKRTKTIIQKIFATNLHFYKEIGSTIQLLEFLEYGVAIHHSGLLPIQKELVEILFSQGLIKFLFATETFAVGVNMPTKSVVFTELSKFDGKSEYPRMLRYDEFMQMSGRAGRRGKDDQGLVIYCPLRNLEDKHDLLGLLRGKAAKLTSQYDEGANTYLRMLNNTADNEEIRKFYNSTLFGMEAVAHIKYLEKEKLTIQQKLDEISLDTSLLTTQDNEIIAEYSELQKQCEKAKNKQKKTLQRKLQQLEQSFTVPVKRYFEKVDDHDKIQSNLKLLEECMEVQSGVVDDKLHFITEFNKQLGLIVENEGNMQITSYGKIVASLSNCSEIVLGKVIQQKMLESVDWKTVGVLLACFAPERSSRDMSEDDIWAVVSKTMETDQKELLDDVWVLYQQILEVYDKYEIQHRLNMSFQFVEPFIMWIEKKPLPEIMAKYDGFDGNFVKNIFKIRDICNELLKVCANFNLENLQEKINLLMESLIYGIGEFNSLYIHHYDLISSL